MHSSAWIHTGGLVTGIMLISLWKFQAMITSVPGGFAEHSMGIIRTNSPIKMEKFGEDWGREAQQMDFLKVGSK